MISSCGEALVDLVTDAASDFGSVAVPGGGPMNVAVAVARLGVPSAFVGRVSTDEYGDLIWRYLTENGVVLAAAERGPEPTARAIVEHTPQLVFRFEGTDTADTQMAAVDLGLLDAEQHSGGKDDGQHGLDQHGAGKQILHGGTLGLFRGRTAETLATLVEQHTGLVSLDPNVRPQIITEQNDQQRWHHFHDRWLAQTHIYKASEEDLAWIWPGRNTSDCATELLAGRAQVVLVTHGSNGATCYTSAPELMEFSVPGKQVDVIDTVGAGDTFVGAVLASLHDLGISRDRGAGSSGVGLADTGVPAASNPPVAGNASVASSALAGVTAAQWRQITVRAVLASAITCTRIGADPPSAAELDEFEELAGGA